MRSCNQVPMTPMTSATSLAPRRGPAQRRFPRPASAAVPLAAFLSVALRNGPQAESWDRGAWNFSFRAVSADGEELLPRADPD